MPDTFEALAVVVLALLPGALYTWGYERQVGSWGITRSDRLLRFIGGSIAFHVIAAPLTYFLYSKYWVSSVIRRGDPLPWWLWGLIVCYVLVPFLVGDLIGRDARRGGRINKSLAGPNPAPTAWDHFFSSNPRGWVRIRLMSGRWVGGLFLSNVPPPVASAGTRLGRLRGTLNHWWKLARSRDVRWQERRERADAANRSRLSRAYAAAYPETQDIYLPYTVIVDPDTGSLIPGADGKPQIRTRGLLLKWETIEYIEVTPFEPWP
jgi:uncharacterized protein DUF6338